MKTIKISLVLALAYFVTGRLGLMLPAFGSNITLLWLPTGIAVAALLRWGFGCWPGIALGAFAVNLAIGTPGPAALGIAVGNTLATLLTVWVLQRMRFHPAFDRSRDILLLTAGAAVGMLVSSGIGVAILSGTGVLPPGARVEAWLAWWGGDALGVITAAPLVLTFTQVEVRGILRRRVEFLTWFVATGLTMWAVFVVNRGAPGEAWALAFVPLPLVAWAALRFGAVGTSLGLIVISVGAAYGTATQSGPFFRGNPAGEVVLLWIYMATSAVLGWLISALRAARVQATATHRLFERALTDVSLGVLLAGLDRRITYANEGFTRLTGYAEAELLGKSCALLHGLETDPATVEKLKTALRGDGFFDGEILNYRKDGTPFWNALLISPVLDEGGATTGFLGLQRDITARKRSEQALIESEDRFRKLIEHAPEAIQILDVTSGRFLLVNSASERLFKLSADALSRTGPMELSPPLQPDGRSSSEKGMEFVARTMAGETPVFEWTHRDAEGRDFPCEVRLLRMEIGGRAVVRGSITDISERKAGEAALRASEQYRRTIIEAEPECVKVLSADGTLIDMNRAGLDMLEAGSLAEAASCPLMRYLLPEHQKPFAELHQLVMAGGSGILEFEIQGLKGTRRWLETHAVLLPGADGGKPALLGITRDVTERKKAQAEAQRSQERFATIFRASPDAIMIVRASDERIVEVNPAFERMLGFTAAEALGRTTVELGLWVNLAERAATIARIQANGAVSNGEARLRSKDGRSFDALSSAEIITYDGEHCILSLTRDITERKAAEERLRRSEASLAAAQHIAALGSWELDLTDPVHPDQNPLIWSDEVFRIFGHEPGGIDVTGENFLLAVHPDDRERVQQAVAEAIAQRHPYRIDHRIVRPDGTERMVQEYSVITTDAASGRPLRMLGVVQDITERKAAEERIRNINAELEQRVEERTAQIDRLYRRQAALAEIELAVHQPAELQRVLDRAVAVGSEGLGTRGGASLVLWDAQQECFTVSASTVPGQPEQLAARRIRRSGGASRWIVDHRQPLLVPDIREDPFRANSMLPEYGMQSYAGVPLFFEEQALGVFYVLHDQPRAFSDEDVAFMEAIASRVSVAIFKVRLYERVQGVNRMLWQRSAELEAANKELEAFSYSVSHDLRAPLRAIDGFSKILEQDASSQLDAKSLRYLDRIRSGTERMSVLIDDMLKLSRLSRAPMNRVELDLSLMVGEALAELRAAGPERQVESVVAPDLKAEGDASLLRAVLENFVSNAWKYTSRRPRARIEFGAFDREGERVFFIRDDGAGFDMAYADKLFGAFQRLHGMDEFEGTGIGLATVQRVIHRHGGRVWAEAAVNEGATFYFTLAPKIEPS